MGLDDWPLLLGLVLFFLYRAVGSSFEVVRPSGHVRLCVLVFFNVITSCHNQYNCFGKAYTTKLTKKCWICILFRNLPLLEGK